MNIYWFLGLIFIISILIGWGLLDDKILLSCLLATSAIVLVRAIPMQYPTMVWWGDPHYYFIGTRGILEANNLNISENFILWYPQVQRQVTWFILHLQTVSMIKILGVENLNTAMRFVPSLFGILTFFGLISVYKFYMGLNWAIYTAYFTSMMDVIVFYQTEYHAQGVGFVFSILLLYVVIKVLRGGLSNRSSLLVIITVIFGFAASHHLSGIVFTIVLFIFASLLFIEKRLYGLNMFYVNLRGIAYLLAILVLSISVIHLFVSTRLVVNIIISIYEIITNSVAPTRPSRGTRLTSELGILNFLPTLLKGVFMLISLYSIQLGLFGEKNTLYRELTLLLISTGIIALGIVVSGFDVVTRLILFGYVPLVALVMISFIHLTKSNTNYRYIRLVGVVFFVAICISISITAAYPPSLVDSTADIRADSYNEIEPVGYQGIDAGKWLDTYFQEQDVFVTIYTHTSAHYYGELDYQQINYIRGKSVSGYRLQDSERSRISVKDNVLYSNGRYYLTKTK